MLFIFAKILSLQKHVIKEQLLLEFDNARKCFSKVESILSLVNHMQMYELIICPLT
jgi:hypothetical protein